MPERNETDRRQALLGSTQARLSTSWYATVMLRNLSAACAAVAWEIDEAAWEAAWNVYLCQRKAATNPS